MKVYDTLIRVNSLDLSSPQSRIRNGVVYAYCHELNSVSKKSGKQEHYFVLSNRFSNKYIIKRSMMESDELGITICYNPLNYDKMLYFQGTSRVDEKKHRLSSNVIKRYIFNPKTGSLVKKIEVFSKKGSRPINLFKTEYNNVELKMFDQEYMFGLGARKSYGCGLIIPTKVYSHLLGFVKK